MNRAKKLVSMLLALVMVFTMAGAVAEDGEDTATVTLGANHTYDAYQIFTGTQAASEGALGDVKWGNGVNSDALLTDLQKLDAFKDCATAADVANVLAKEVDDSDLAKKFANIVAQHLSDTKTAITADVDLPKGYYLLVDTTEVGEGDAKNSALLHLTDDVTITVKYTVPSLDKDIIEDNQNVESADKSIGDTVKYQLTGTLPSNLDDYKTYTYIFHDTMSSGLTLTAGSIKVYLVNGDSKTEITDNAQVKIAPSEADLKHSTCTFEVQIGDLKQITGVTASSTIVVEYEAVVNDTAVIGAVGNPNEAYIEYSNNPNYAGDGNPTTGNTPEDEVLVFTYELDVTKIDSNDANKKLADAEFVLMNSDQTMVAKIANGKFAGWVADADITKNADGTYPADYTLKSEADGTFSITGLDADTYYLKETKAPAGYNLLTAPIKVVIAASLDQSEDNPELTALTISVDDGTAVSGATDTTGKLTGEVAMDVKNNSGATLPETGGVGTTMLYVGGGALIAVAVVMLVAKKRKA